MNIEECLQQGLLVKTEKDKEKARASLKMAEHKLQIAEKELNAKIAESAIISAYSAMFHCARAILFKDGFKERSHYAAWVYLNEKYGNAIERKFLLELGNLRLQRHELLYGLENSGSNDQDAKAAIDSARGFLERVKRLIS